jgi:hypothetical protein
LKITNGKQNVDVWFDDGIWYIDPTPGMLDSLAYGKFNVESAARAISDELRCDRNKVLDMLRQHYVKTVRKV